MDDISTLPVEIQMYILSKLPYWQIKRYCQASTLTNMLCNTPYLWSSKAELEFAVPREKFFNTELSPDDRYLELKFMAKFDQYDCLLNMINTITCLRRIIADDDLDLIIFLLKNGLVDINQVMLLAIDEARQDIIEWAIHKGADQYNLIYEFIDYYHSDKVRQTVETLIKSINDRDIISNILASLLLNAAHGGYPDTVKVLLELGLPRYYSKPGADLLTINAILNARWDAEIQLEKSDTLAHQHIIYEDIIDMLIDVQRMFNQ